jgi:hypothetical protein
LLGEEVPLRRLHLVLRDAAAGGEEAGEAVLRDRVPDVGGLPEPLRGGSFVGRYADAVEEADGVWSSFTPRPAS